MPAKSEKQRRYFAWCYKHSKNDNCPKMPKAKMHEFMYKAKGK